MSPYKIIPLLLLLSACDSRQKSDTANATTPTAVIYHGDSREDVATIDPASELMAATALLIEDHKLKPLENAFLLNVLPLKKQYPLCPDQKFLDQPTVGFCSGVLIAENKVLTAGHCVNSKDFCKKTKFIFGWNLEKSFQSPTPGSEIFSCKNILDQKTTSPKRLDYAVIELDRPVKNTSPVKIAKDTFFKKGEELLSLSYPLGLPLKKDVGRVLEDIFEKNEFKVEVDTFGGSSGSPLFNSQYELVGILSSGMDDILEDDIYRIQKEGGCLRFNQCPEGTCFGESYVKVPRIDL